MTKKYTPTNAEIEDNSKYTIVDLNYSDTFIFKAADAITFLECMQRAEKVNSQMYEEEFSIEEDQTVKMNVRNVTKTQYRNAKINALLNLHEKETAESDVPVT